MRTQKYTATASTHTPTGIPMLSPRISCACEFGEAFAVGARGVGTGATVGMLVTTGGVVGTGVVPAAAAHAHSVERQLLPHDATVSGKFQFASLRRMTSPEKTEMSLPVYSHW